jgi:hypothetical protein
MTMGRFLRIAGEESPASSFNNRVAPDRSQVNVSMKHPFLLIANPKEKLFAAGADFEQDQVFLSVGTGRRTSESWHRVLYDIFLTKVRCLAVPSEARKEQSPIAPL